jgi:hypothetical protein
MLWIQTWTSTVLAEHHATNPGEIDEGAGRKGVDADRTTERMKRRDSIEIASATGALKARRAYPMDPHLATREDTEQYRYDPDLFGWWPSITPGVVRSRGLVHRDRRNDSTRGTHRGS